MLDILKLNQESWDADRAPDPAKEIAGPRVLVLVDRYCGSDGEFITTVLAAHPGAVIAGENTFGVAQFIRPAYFVLPHTRVPFRLAMGASDMYGDGRSVDGYGLDVDVVFRTAADFSAENVLALARRLARTE